MTCVECSFSVVIWQLCLKIKHVYLISALATLHAFMKVAMASSSTDHSFDLFTEFLIQFAGVVQTGWMIRQSTTHWSTWSVNNHLNLSLFLTQSIIWLTKTWNMYLLWLFEALVLVIEWFMIHNSFCVPLKVTWVFQQHDSGFQIIIQSSFTHFYWKIKQNYSRRRWFLQCNSCRADHLFITVKEGHQWSSFTAVINYWPKR